MEREWYTGWNTGLKVVECPVFNTFRRLLVQKRILFVMRELDRLFPDTEFLIYARASIDGTSGRVYDPAIPKQVVSYGSVHVTRPDVTRNAVIHKHPPYVYMFSFIDDEYINSNNDVSLLYVDGEIIEGIVRIRLPCGAYGLARVEEIQLYGDDEEEKMAAARLVKEQARNIKRAPPYYMVDLRERRRAEREQETRRSRYSTVEHESETGYREYDRPDYAR